MRHSVRRSSSAVFLAGVSKYLSRTRAADVDYRGRAKWLRELRCIDAYGDWDDSGRLRWRDTRT
jgi:hypothetical protein